MDVNEVEFAFPALPCNSVKADVFAGLHKESNGQRKGCYILRYIWCYPILVIAVGTIVGKKFWIKLTQRWEFTDRPLA